jgi:hypothetical protein
MKSVLKRIHRGISERSAVLQKPGSISVFRSRSKGPIPYHSNRLLPLVVADSASSFYDTKINKKICLRIAEVIIGLQLLLARVRVSVFQVPFTKIRKLVNKTLICKRKNTNFKEIAFLYLTDNNVGTFHPRPRYAIAHQPKYNVYLIKCCLT